jgi:hypothetical protein
MRGDSGSASGSPRGTRPGHIATRCSVFSHPAPPWQQGRGLDTAGTQRPSDAARRCRCLVKEGLVRFVLSPVAQTTGISSVRGVWEARGGQSGERLEIRWEGSSRDTPLLFPSPRHPASSRDALSRRLLQRVFFAPTWTGTLSRQARYVQWVSSDYGRDDGVPVTSTLSLRLRRGEGPLYLWYTFSSTGVLRL